MSKTIRKTRDPGRPTKVRRETRREQQALRRKLREYYRGVS